MFKRLVVLSILLLSAAGFTTVTGVTNPAPAEITVQMPDCAGCTYVHVWINGVRWMYVYGPDGAVINMYPDPEE